jgi:hypothetical protein
MNHGSHTLQKRGSSSLGADPCTGQRIQGRGCQPLANAVVTAQAAPADAGDALSRIGNSRGSAESIDGDVRPVNRRQPRNLQ